MGRVMTCESMAKLCRSMGRYRYQNIHGFNINREEYDGMSIYSISLRHSEHQLFVVDGDFRKAVYTVQYRKEFS